MTVFAIIKESGGYSLCETNEKDNARYAVNDCNQLVVAMTAIRELADVLLETASSEKWTGRESALTDKHGIVHKLVLLPDTAIAVGNRVIVLVWKDKAKLA